MTERIANLADYQEVRSTFCWKCPSRFNFGVDVVDAWAESHPEKTAIHWVGPSGERIVTYREIATRSDQVAHALATLGLKSGDRILILLPRIVEWWEALIGVFKAAMVAMPGTTLLTRDDIAYRVKAAGAAAVITDRAGAGKVDEIVEGLPELKYKIVVGDPSGMDGWHSYAAMLKASPSPTQTAPQSASTRSDDPALIYFTSGTTGPPKMVLHTHASYGVGLQVTGQCWLDLREDDLHWNISDTGWAKAAWSSLFGPWICGAGVFVHDSREKFAPTNVLDCLVKYPITTMCAPPTIYRMLVQQDLSGFHPAALRHCVAAGEPLDGEVISTWKQATGLTIRDGYGQTETVLLCGNFPGLEVKPGSMGLPAPGFDLAVIDQDGNRLPAGAEGDIALRIEPDRPLGMFREYWRHPEATAQAFRHGWYVTGDRALTDDDGYFWFVGRADDVITSSAYRIGPFEVESALMEHPLVAEAAVIGKPDPMRGQIVKAFVVLTERTDGSEELKSQLQEHVKQATAPYKYPREIEFVSELPKTTSGKIRRVELRQRS